MTELKLIFLVLTFVEKLYGYSRKCGKLVTPQQVLTPYADVHKLVRRRMHGHNLRSGFLPRKYFHSLKFLCQYGKHVSSFILANKVLKSFTRYVCKFYVTQYLAQATPSLQFLLSSLAHSLIETCISYTYSKQRSMSQLPLLLIINPRRLFLSESIKR